MKNSTISHKETQQDKAQRLKAGICELLECKPEQYAEFQYQSGLRYLIAYLPNDAHSQRLLTYSKVFWNWWKNHWTIRDEEFLCLAQKYTIRNREIVLQLYLQYNNGKYLANEFHPNAIVLNETYAGMINELIGEQTQKTES